MCDPASVCREDRKAIDLAHSAGADLLNDFVDAKAAARSDSQTLRIIRAHRHRATGLAALGADSLPSVRTVLKLGWRGLCVTASVAVGSQRDGQDSGQRAMVEAYLP